MSGIQNSAGGGAFRRFKSGIARFFRKLTCRGNQDVVSETFAPWMQKEESLCQSCCRKYGHADAMILQRVSQSFQPLDLPTSVRIEESESASSIGEPELETDSKKSEFDESMTLPRVTQSSEGPTTTVNDLKSGIESDSETSEPDDSKGGSEPKGPFLDRDAQAMLVTRRRVRQAIACLEGPHHSVTSQGGRWINHPFYERVNSARTCRNVSNLSSIEELGPNSDLKETELIPETSANTEKTNLASEILTLGCASGFGGLPSNQNSRRVPQPFAPSLVESVMARHRFAVENRPKAEPKQRCYNYNLERQYNYA